MINWKDQTQLLAESLVTNETVLLPLRGKDGRGIWVLTGPSMTFEGFTLKKLRTWLWEQRVCRTLKRSNPLVLWASKEGESTVVGFAEQVEGAVGQRWIQMGGPAL
jgi:hypothetical protein